MTKYNINIIEIVSYLENHQPSTLELSMTEEQLFRQKNPLWARGYTRQDLMTVVYLYQMISAKHITNNHDTICDILYANHKKNKRLDGTQRLHENIPEFIIWYGWCAWKRTWVQ